MRPIAASLVVALLSPSVASQCTEDPADLSLTVTPTQAAAGQPFTATLTNQSAGCTYELPLAGCTITWVAIEDCFGDTALFPICPPGPTPLGPGQSVVEVWDQTNDFGEQVDDGLYWIKVDAVTPSGALLELCAPVQVGFGCVSPFAFGSGSAGTDGFVPSLSAIGGTASLGSTSFGVALTNGLGGANAFVLASLAQASFDLGFGTILIDTGQLVLNTVLPLSAGDPGQGIGLLTVPVPSNPALVGLEVFFQGAVPDAGAAGNFALTPGLRVVVCP